MPLAKQMQHYTYANILKWDESERYELLDGEVIMMAPPQ
jgi:hypothetical protein